MLHSWPESTARECYSSSLGNTVHMTCLSPSFLQIWNIKCDPILALEINKQRKIVKCEVRRQLNLLGSEQLPRLGKAMHNSFIVGLKLLLINWIERQTI